ncbi:MAG: DUF2934 domain-containing protein [Gammaproteobacteria bacterium]
MGKQDKTGSDAGKTSGKTTRKKSTAPKTAVKKAAPKAKAAAKTKATTKTKASAKTKSNGGGSKRKPAITKRARASAVAKAPTPQQRWQMIAEIAYLRAERRGFTGGNPLDDWLAAEAEVDHRLSGT